MGEEANGVLPPDATQTLMEMMEAMQKQNEEHAEEFRRALKEKALKREK